MARPSKSLDAVKEFAEELPYRFREDVISYARSVRDAVPDIFKEAQYPLNEDLAEQIIFIAGVKKLYSIFTAHFWTISNSLFMLERSEVHSVRIGSRLIYKSSDDYFALSELVRHLDHLLSEHRMLEFIHQQSYPEILKALKT